MPDVRRPRYVISESDEVAAALVDAARRWREDRDSPAKLLRHLIAEGHRAVLAAADRDRKRRLAAIRRTSGALTGAYEADELEKLRRDWPA